MKIVLKFYKILPKAVTWLLRFLEFGRVYCELLNKG